MNIVNARIDCEKDIVTIGLGDMSHEFNFASIAVPPTDPLEQYLLDHENDMFMDERREIDKVFLQQGPILKHNYLLKS